MACKTVARSGGSAGIDLNLQAYCTLWWATGRQNSARLNRSGGWGTLATMNQTTTARTTSRRNVMRWSVAAVVAALGRSPLALAGDEADPDADVIPFLDPQPYDPKRAMLNWDELKITDWLTPTAQVYHVSHYG